MALLQRLSRAALRVTSLSRVSGQSTLFRSKIIFKSRFSTKIPATENEKSDDLGEIEEPLEAISHESVQAVFDADLPISDPTATSASSAATTPPVVPVERAEFAKGVPQKKEFQVCLIKIIIHI